MLDFLGPQVPIRLSLFRIPRVSGLICGFWPQHHRSWLTVLMFWFSTSVVALGAFGENLYGFVHLDDLFAALEAFCPGMTKAICLLKMLLFFIYYKDWSAIVQRLKHMLMEDKNTEKLKIVEKLASIASIFSFILLTSGSTTNAFFNIVPLIKNLYRYSQGLEVQAVLPFNIVLPDIFVDYPLYPLTYCILALSGAMTVFTFSAVDGFFVCACMYSCGLFRMLQHDIRQIFAELQKYEQASSAQNSRIRSELAKAVRRHNAIIDLCSDFTAQFTLIILMHFLSAALVVCSSILDLMLCIGGNYVSESSLEVANTVYDIAWYKCDVETRKMILMILRRSQKAKTIAVPFFTPSLSAFSSIISTAGSYITLLKTFL
ncbi:odorant receptor 22c [Teleopsis dalmanni]|uniref:odorant receptor 22c n=1 Tax=Teleopsis dalmanni TaxID=139649 RepID=UPI0018CDDBC8|nr:odorant receptor 22c [Teleopsis dalmanni]